MEGRGRIVVAGVMLSLAAMLAVLLWSENADDPARVPADVEVVEDGRALGEVDLAADGSERASIPRSAVEQVGQPDGVTSPIEPTDELEGPVAIKHLLR